MINQELLLLLHHIFFCLAPGYWYSLEDEDECIPTSLATARLNQFQIRKSFLKSVITKILSGIINRQFLNELSIHPNPTTISWKFII
jgi:hypothetical protein